MFVFFFFIMISEKNILVNCSKKYLLLKFTTKPTKNYLISTILYIVQEVVMKTISKKKKCKKAKWLSEEALQIAEKRKEMKSKGKKGKIYSLNAKFQTIARRDKKAFIDEQCEEIEENNRMGKTRDLFQKIRDTKGTFHTEMGTHTHTHTNNIAWT